jgi:hypothetical protein
MGNIVLYEADARTEAEYNRAVNELLAGNTVIAYSIVQQWLQQPRNSNSVRLRELLQRIQALL